MQTTINNKDYTIEIKDGIIWVDEEIEIKELFVYDEDEDQEIEDPDIDFWLDLISYRDSEILFQEFFEKEKKEYIPEE